MSIHRAARCENVPEFPESTANSRRTRWSRPSRSRPTAWGAVFKRVRRKHYEPKKVGVAKTASISSGFQSYRDRFGIPAATFIFNRKSRPDGAFSQISRKLCPMGKSSFGGIDKACFGIPAKPTPRSRVPPRGGTGGTIETLGLVGEKSPSATSKPPQNFRLLPSPLTPVSPLLRTAPRDRSP